MLTVEGTAPDEEFWVSLLTRKVSESCHILLGEFRRLHSPNQNQSQPLNLQLNSTCCSQSAANYDVDSLG
jgi:hypothetical protein